MNARLRSILVATVAMSALMAPATAQPSPRGLVQLPGALGCLPGPMSTCLPAASRPFLPRDAWVAGDPSGRHLYVLLDTGVTARVQAFERDRRSGRLTPVIGPGGCVGRGVPGCTAINGLRNGLDLAVAGDGRHVYVLSRSGPGTIDTAWPATIAVLRRDPRTGALRQSRGSAGCVSSEALRPCAFDSELSGAESLVPAPEGRDLFVVRPQPSISVVIRRQRPGAGGLGVPPGRLGCVQPGEPACMAGGLPEDWTERVLVRRDGRRVFLDGTAIIGLRRDPRSGRVAPLPGSCLGSKARRNCPKGRGFAAEFSGLGKPASDALSPDGRTIYVAGLDRVDVVRVSRRGRLTQPAGPKACIGYGSTDCTRSRGFGAASTVVAPDGRGLYLVHPNLGLTAFSRDRRRGTLLPRSVGLGCSAKGQEDSCGRAPGLISPDDALVAPGGRFVYVVSGDAAAVAILERERRTHGLGPSSCTLLVPSAACATPLRGGPSISDPGRVTVSPDGRSVYTNATDGGLLVLQRDAETGGLTQLPGAAGCLPTRAATGCGPPVLPVGRWSITVAPDGASAYAVSDQALVAFRRTPSGVLTRMRVPDGCLSYAGNPFGCRIGPYGPIAISPDGQDMYVFHGDTLRLVHRGMDGVPLPTSGAEGCVTGFKAEPECRLGRGLQYGSANAIVMTRNGTRVYTLSWSGLAAFIRDPATGVLTQREGSGACLTFPGTASGQEGCGVLPGFGRMLVLAPDGRHLYGASATSDQVPSTVIALDTSTGDMNVASATGGLPTGTSTAEVLPDGGAVVANTGLFARDPQSGTLSPEGGVCVWTLAQSCGPLVPPNPNAGNSGAALASSTDGRHAYVVANGSVYTFAINR